ncbi:MAG: hypothetical protein ACK5Y8_03265, partial [Betaproteobacteria bacterium]
YVHATTHRVYRHRSLTGLRQRTPLQIVGFTHGVSVPNSRKLSSALKNPASVGGQLPNLG